MAMNAAQCEDNISEIYINLVQSNNTLFSDIKNLLSSSDDSAKVKELIQKAIEHQSKAVSLYVEEYDVDKAIKSEKRLAEGLEKLLSSDNVSIKSSHELILGKVIEKYSKAVELMVGLEGNKVTFHLPILEKSFSVCVRYGRLVESLVLLEKEEIVLKRGGYSSRVHKVFLKRVVVCLLRKDVVRAKDEFRKCLGENSFVSSSECEVSEKLIKAYEESSRESIEIILKKPLMNHLPNIIIHKLKNLIDKVEEVEAESNNVKVEKTTTEIKKNKGELEFLC